MTHTIQSLCAFTARVKEAFLAKQIRAPVHLCSDTQAEPLLKVFEDVRPGDWVFSGWRSSFHALLKGIPEEWVFSEILAGRSMYLMSKEHRFLCSSIVGGILPVACGVGMGIKRAEKTLRHRLQLSVLPMGISFDEFVESRRNRVWVFIGDMTARCGLFHEFLQYVQGHNLPVKVIVEDNGMSTDTPTDDAWGKATVEVGQRQYRYQRTHPHVGVGQNVSF